MIFTALCDIFQFCLKSDENETLYEYVLTFVKLLTFCGGSTVNPLLQSHENIPHPKKGKERRKEISRSFVNILLRYGEILCVV